MNTKMWVRLFVVAMLAVLLSACATPNFITIGDQKFAIDPPAQLGVGATKAIQSGDFLVVEAFFPSDLTGEIRDVRIRWPAFAVGTDKAGKVVTTYPAQAIFVGYRGCENPKRVFHVFIEGAKSHPSYDMKIAIASTMLTKLYGLDGTGPIPSDTEKTFADDKDYRNERISLIGTSFNVWTSSGHQIDELDYSEKMFPKMHVYDVFKDSEGLDPIITGLDKGQVGIVARKNPGYKFGERAMRDASWAQLAPSPYSVASAILFGLMADGMSNSSGWDEKSSTTGEELHAAFEYDAALRSASKKDCGTMPRE